MRLFVRLVRRSDGQDLIEYALLASLISVSVVLILGPLGNKITGSYSRIDTTLTSATSQGGNGGPGNSGNGNGGGRGNSGGNGNGQSGGN